MSFNINRIQGENEEQYLWRLGQAKDNGLIDLDWEGIAQLINREFREDESEYRTEAAYRKPYQQASRFYHAGIFAKDEDKYIKELRDAKHELRKEKQKLFDERTSLNKTLREQARVDNDLAYLEDVISKKAFNALPPHNPVSISSDNDMIICLSDLHYGLFNSGAFGQYSSDIATERMSNYCDKIQELQKLHNSENAYIILLGDEISGAIHQTIQLENRENLVEQIQGAAELIASFVYALSAVFNNVYVANVGGNHSRSALKDDVLRGERFDNLIPWYMKAALKHIENVHFINQKYDSTICDFEVRGQKYIGVHGDFDSFSEAGVSKLVMMLGYKPTGILFGHMHHNSYDDIYDVKIIRSGSFAGTGDNYCIQKRLYGKPGQMVSIVNAKGVECCYPIEL